MLNHHPDRFSHTDDDGQLPLHHHEARHQTTAGTGEIGAQATAELTIDL